MVNKKAEKRRKQSKKSGDFKKEGIKMGKIRKYEAQGDTGKDFIFFEFYSEYRAGSKANIEDAHKEYKKKHGHDIRILKVLKA